MDIKKLGLASTVAMLSVTVALGGCDLLNKSQAEIEGDKARDERYKASAEVDKACCYEEINTPNTSTLLLK
ncbi:hypothetical protein [Candidatus Liberibacter solanacearum]|uniref:Lipoprotein n=2 Tax=Candidatus Liberibacter solanacearum TaxID=556287 RepID=A0A1V2N7U6_9HYPH|nr:hypothetical protein [Candidatus Liberibacter solanacearum]ONI59269.1 hypothetical protein AYJ09_02645 [Candidatus Liberibacter solanacearum]ONI59629.1 hypothetical protein AYO25_03215 [Candidatus Liberibacter solanacearum]